MWLWGVTEPLSSGGRLHCRTTGDCGSTAGCRHRRRAERRRRAPARFSPQGSGPSSEAAVSHVRASAVGLEDDRQRRGQCSEVAVVDTAVLHLVGNSLRSGAQSRRVGVTGTRASTRRSTTSTTDRPQVAARPCSQARRRQPTEHHFGMGPRERGVMTPPHQAQDTAAARRAPPISGCVRRCVRLRGLVGGTSPGGPLSTLSFGFTSAGSVVGAPSNCHALSVRGDLLEPVRRVPRPEVHEV